MVLPWLQNYNRAQIVAAAKPLVGTTETVDMLGITYFTKRKSVGYGLEMALASTRELWTEAEIAQRTASYGQRRALVFVADTPQIMAEQHAVLAGLFPLQVEILGLPNPGIPLQLAMVIPYQKTEMVLCSDLKYEFDQQDSTNGRHYAFPNHVWTNEQQQRLVPYVLPGEWFLRQLRFAFLCEKQPPLF